MLGKLSLKTSCVWRLKLGTPVFGEFILLFSVDALKFCQVGCGVSLYSYFQVSPEMFKSRLCLGHSRTFSVLSPSHLGARFPTDVTLGIQAKKSSILFSSDQRNLCLMVWESFRCLFNKLQAGSTIKAWLVECCRDGSPSVRFSNLHRGTLEPCQSDHRVLGHLPDQGTFHPIA